MSCWLRIYGVIILRRDIALGGEEITDDDLRAILGDPDKTPFRLPCGSEGPMRYAISRETDGQDYPTETIAISLWGDLRDVETSECVGRWLTRVAYHYRLPVWEIAINAICDRKKIRTYAFDPDLWDEKADMLRAGDKAKDKPDIVGKKAYAFEPVKSIKPVTIADVIGVWNDEEGALTSIAFSTNEYPQAFRISNCNGIDFGKEVCQVERNIYLSFSLEALRKFANKYYDSQISLLRLFKTT